MLTNDEKREFQKLWNKASISLKGDSLNVDGLTFQVHQEVVAPPTVAPIYDAQTGWAVNAPSEIGGLRSKRVDATIQEAINAGYPEAAAMVPKYHLGHFWAAPSTIFGWATPDPARFAMPLNNSYGSLTQNQLEQIQDNLMANDNSMFTLIGMSTGGNGSNMYRGEKGSAHGFAPVNVTTGEVDFSPANPPGYVPNKLETVFPRNYVTATKYSRSYAPGNLNAWTRVVGKEYPDHYIYDSWWNTQTDEHVNRFWRSWLISVGVPIKLEG